MTTRFQRQLEELHVQMITLGSLCEKVISLATKASSSPTARSRGS